MTLNVVFSEASGTGGQEIVLTRRAAIPTKLIAFWGSTDDEIVRNVQVKSSSYTSCKSQLIIISTTGLQSMAQPKCHNKCQLPGDEKGS